ncbi:MAG: LysM peptidoglycan-binding domain-containing protein [Acidimicrobiales bacterium]
MVAVLVTMLTCLALVGGLRPGRPSRAGQPGRSGPSITRAGALDAAPAGVRLYVVKPGDTLWGIATSLAGNGDPRPIMDRLARQVPTGVLVVGERLALP